MKSAVSFVWLILKCGFVNRPFLIHTNPHFNISNNDNNNFDKIYYLLRLTQFSLHSQTQSKKYFLRLVQPSSALGICP